jgi:hypothetical protein
MHDIILGEPDVAPISEPSQVVAFETLQGQRSLFSPLWLVLALYVTKWICWVVRRTA